MKSKPDFPIVKLRLVAGYAMPSVLFIIAIFIMLLPWQIAYFSTIKPELPLIVLFFWMCLKPDSIPPITVFFGAAITDIFSPVPLGYYSLLYFFIYGLILWRSPRLNVPNIFLFFAEFAAIAIIFYLLSWVFNSIMGNGAAVQVNILFAWSMSLCAFWIIFPLLHLSHKAYPVARVKMYNLRWSQALEKQ